MMRFNFVTATFSAIFALLVLTGCKPEPSTVYIALETSTPTEAELAKYFLYSMSRRAKGQFFVIDVLHGSDTHNLHSNPANRRVLQRLELEENLIPANDEALIQAFQRVKDLTRELEQAEIHPLYVYIVTDGTSNRSTLESVRHICQEIAEMPGSDNVHVALVGLAPAHRVATASALSPIAEQAASASRAYEEWIQLVRKL